MKRAARRTARQRGAVALEYLLLAAVVAVALMSVLRYWGECTAKAVKISGGQDKTGQGALLPP